MSGEALDRAQQRAYAAAILADVVMRVCAGSARPQPRSGADMRWGPLASDFVRQSVRIEGREIALQPLQLRLLGFLMRSAGRRVSREELRAHVFRSAQQLGSTNVARQICLLRARLGTDGALIVTVPGGYALG